MKVTKKETSGVESKYCNTKAESPYDSCADGYEFDTKTFVVPGLADGVSKEDYDISRAYYITKSMNKELQYDTPRVFYTSFPTGNIIYQKAEKEIINSSNSVQTEVVDGLPVSLTTDKGLHQFSFEVDNLGEYYNNCTGGRLVDKDTDNDSVEDVVANGLKFTGEYICYYRVNCPDCEFTCGDDIQGKCDITIDKKCPECIYNTTTDGKNGNLNLTYRPVSPDVLIPNDREPGYNWNYNYNINDKYGFVAGKADETVNDEEFGILTLGDKIYDGKSSFEIKLTPELAEYLKDYNEKAEGGYSNDTLTCYNYEYDGVTYKNIFCYSDLLDKLNSLYKDNIIFMENRPKDKSSRNQSNNTKYWTVYIDKIPVRSEVSIGGPAWK